MQQEGIYGFQPPFDFLSNFHIVDVVYDGAVYRSTEHAYQAAKSLDPAEREKIRNTFHPGSAKKLGRTLTIRSDWEEVKVEIMLNLLLQKFNYPHLRDMLISTEDLYIEETNYWGDIFWGVCRGVGQNILGQLLMEIRSKFLDNPSEIS